MAQTAQETLKRGNVVIREHLSSIDITILEDLLKISTAALYDAETISRVSEITGINTARIAAIVPVIAELSQGISPAIRNEKDIENLIVSVSELERNR